MAVIELSWARSLQVSAELAGDVQTRQQACLAAARSGADALLGRSPRVRAVQASAGVWTALAAEQPALAEWAGYFALLEGCRLSVRQADDLLRDVAIFLDQAEQLLGRRVDRVGHG